MILAGIILAHELPREIIGLTNTNYIDQVCRYIMYSILNICTVFAILNQFCQWVSPKVQEKHFIKSPFQFYSSFCCCEITSASYHIAIIYYKSYNFANFVISNILASKTYNQHTFLDPYSFFYICPVPNTCNNQNHIHILLLRATSYNL